MMGVHLICLQYSDAVGWIKTEYFPQNNNELVSFSSFFRIMMVPYLVLGSGLFWTTLVPYNDLVCCPDFEVEYSVLDATFNTDYKNNVWLTAWFEWTYDERVVHLMKITQWYLIVMISYKDKRLTFHGNVKENWYPSYNNSKLIGLKRFFNWQ